MRKAHHRGANFILPDCKPHVFQQIAEEVEFLCILFYLAQRLILSLYYHYAICSFMCQQTRAPGTYINTLETQFLSQMTRLLKRRPVFSFNLTIWKELSWFLTATTEHSPTESQHFPGKRHQSLSDSKFSLKNMVLQQLNSNLFGSGKECGR